MRGGCAWLQACADFHIFFLMQAMLLHAGRHLLFIASQDLSLFFHASSSEYTMLKGLLDTLPLYLARAGPPSQIKTLLQALLRRPE